MIKIIWINSKRIVFLKITNYQNNTYDFIPNISLVSWENGCLYDWCFCRGLRNHSGRCL